MIFRTAEVALIWIGGSSMSLLPLFIMPSTGALFLALFFPIIGIALLAWFFIRINRIDKSLREILEQIKMQKKG